VVDPDRAVLDRETRGAVGIRLTTDPKGPGFAEANVNVTAPVERQVQELPPAAVLDDDR
jgi:hypothetical protein